MLNSRHREDSCVLGVFLLCGLLTLACRDSRQPPYTHHSPAAHQNLSDDTTVVVIHGPTVVAFDCGTEKSDDPDVGEMLSDFYYHFNSANEEFRKEHIQSSLRYGDHFVVSQDGHLSLVRPDTSQGVVGYYIVSPLSPPKIYYGVLTNSDLIDMVHTYLRGQHEL